MYPNDTSTVNNPDKASTWERRYSKSSGDQTAMFDKFDEWYRMMYAIRDDRNTAKWRSKMHIPLLSTKAWSLIAKFIQQEPGFEVTVRDEDSDELDIDELEEIAEKVQKKLEYDYNNPDLEESIRDKLNACLVDAVVTGTGLAKVPWVTKNKTTYAHPVRNGGVDYTKDKKTVQTIGYNDLEPVNIFNVFIAPSASSLQSAPWVIIKEYKTLAQLQAVNENYGAQIYKNLDQLKNVKAEADKFAQQKKSRQNLTSETDPIIADQTVSLIEIFECYDRDENTICTYAATGSKSGKGKKWITIRETQNPYWHGKFPLVPFYIRRRPFSFWGESLFTTTERLQSGANDLFNHYLDNYNLAVDGGVMIEETSQVNDFLVEPGFELVYRGEQPKQFSFPAPDPNQLTLVMNQIEKSVENATISNYAAGTPVSGLDKTQGTARGTMAILEAATDMIQFMRDNFQASIRTVGEMWLSNNRQFMNFDFPAPILKNNTFTYEMLTPAELQLQMQLRINDQSMQPISDQQKRDNFIAYSDRLVQMQTASIQQSQLTQDQSQALFIDWHAQARELAKQFNTRSFEKQVMPNEKAMAVANQQADEEQMQAEEQANQENDMDNLTSQVADLPSNENMMMAEDALSNLEAANGQ